MLYKLDIITKNTPRSGNDDVNFVYSSVVMWCLDRGYTRRVGYEKATWNDNTDFSIDIMDFLHRGLITVCCTSKTIADNIRTVWIDDEDLWILRPRFNYYNSRTLSSLDDTAKWLDNNIDKADYHVYYRAFNMMLSLRYKSDEALYKMVFLNGTQA